VRRRLAMDWLVMGSIVVGWVLLQYFLLPRLGVPT
jgi:hypothetical protein